MLICFVCYDMLSHKMTKPGKVLLDSEAKLII